MMSDAVPINTLNKSVQLQPRADGLLTVWFDSPARSVNIFNAQMLDGLEAAVAHIMENSQRYRGVVFRSRKPGCFFAGADVAAIAALATESDARSIIQRGQRLMAQIAALPMPSIAAVDGVCMGGGLELALACKHRIASNSPKTKLGLPEIKLGLIPGWGGTQRLPIRVGLRQALKMILTGKSYGATIAQKLGLVDCVLEPSVWQEKLIEACESLLDSHPRRRPPGGLKAWLLDGNFLGRTLVLKLATRQAASQMRHYPALEQALRVVGLACASGGNAYEQECEAFVKLLFTDTARSLLGLFVQRDRARKISTWVEPVPVAQSSPATDPGIHRVAVIGAGVMGAGIGMLAAANGYQVVFKEIHDQAVEAGRQSVYKHLHTEVDRGRIRPSELKEQLARISFTTDWQDLSDCELAIEAVLEIESVKRDVFGQLDRTLRSDAVLTSNTSSLAITRMATATGRRQKVAGLHFFNPVDRMELVEVVRTEATDEATLRRLLAFVRSLGKTPIVTSDKPGFLVNRVLFPYLGEAVQMVAEGHEVAEIDMQMRSFGMPMGPLELLDQVGMDVAAHVAHSLATLQTDAQVPAAFLADMVNQGWLGKKTQCGFYRYGKSKRRQVNSRIKQAALAAANERDWCRDTLSPTQRRLVYPLLNEAVHCLDELVVSEAWMVDLAMVLGTGFAPMHGGPLRCIDQLGPANVLHNLRVLGEVHGARFAPADGLVRAVTRKKTFYASAGESLNWEKDDESRCSTQS